MREAILYFHVSVLVALTAGDYRIGKAYGLGRALADTCASAGGSSQEKRTALSHHLQFNRLSVIRGWLDDLKTALPAHAGEAVSASLQRWELWSQGGQIDQLGESDLDQAVRSLHRCGQRWRAVLSNEKAATDLLEITDYVNVARGTLHRASGIMWSLAGRLWLPVALASVLVGTGIWLMVANNSTAQVIAGLGTLAGGLGVTWRSTATTVGHLSLDLGRPLWEAEVDLAVGNRLTPLPQRDYVPELVNPPSRFVRAWRELMSSDPDRPRGNPAPREAPQEAPHPGASAQGASSK